MNKKYFCVISHTHWDREWYAPLEIFRTRLVDLIDRLLIILEKHPEFVFHLDAQTVVLEDYLTVRPEKKALLKEHIAHRRIVVGPWYLQNDFYLTSGEATVRNLLEGQKLCREFGASGKIGYAPDQFGNISQLPQILDNFGIDNFVFGRGFSEFVKNANGGLDRQPSPTEFVWEGADGTKVLAVHMRHWYNNAQRFSADIDKAEKLLRSIVGCFENEYTLTPYYLLMNGVDHLEAQDNLLEVIDGVQARLKEGEYFLQYNFDDYIADMKQYIEKNEVKLTEKKGELRRGSDWDILKGTLSSRHYLKVANVKAQNLLETKIEPLYSIMEKQGMKGIYPYDHIIYTWKNLLRNHPHDSICGCSRDEVHAHMENRYSEIFEFGNELLRRGMQHAANHTAAQRAGSEEEYLITVANTLSTPRSESVKVELELLKRDEFEGFELFDDAGNQVDFEMVEKKEKEISMFSPINLPGELNVDSCTIWFDSGEVAPYSFKTFIIRKAAKWQELTPIKCCDVTSFENEHLKVEISPDGKVDVTELASGRVMKDCIKIEDVADAGESYVFLKGGDEPVYSDCDCFQKTVTVEEKHGHCKTCAIRYEMNLPAYYDYEQRKRSEEKAVSVLTLELSLKPGQKWMEIGYTLENNSKDHRVRIVVAGDVVSDVSTADIAYDVVTHGEEAHCPVTDSKVLPNTSFAALQQDGKGVAVFTEGAHEYEHMNGNMLAFTIVRATGLISKSNTATWQVPGNQCLRTLQGSMAVMPFEGDIISAGVPAMSQCFRTPLIAAFSACDTRKFSGGRPAVQDTTISEFFYLPDSYPQVSIPANSPAMKVEGEGVVVTAFKKSEDLSGHIVRLCNLSDREQTVSVQISHKIYRTTMAEIRREFLGLDKVEFTMGSKAIVTLFVTD